MTRVTRPPLDAARARRTSRAVRSALLVVAAWLGLATLPGCGGWKGGGARDIHNTGGATVILGTELERTSGSLLQAMVGKVPNMKVNFTGLARCPAIAMRHYEDIKGVNFPDVYVDGTRANNTCILQSLQAHDAERVEVYPMGFTRRPGYGTSTHGLILVFLRSS